jgi:WD40 repeat protein
MITSIGFGSDGTTLVSGSYDNYVRLWRVPDLERLCTLKGHSDSINGVAFSPDGTTVASAGDDKTVRLWKLDRPSSTIGLQPEAKSP